MLCRSVFKAIVVGACHSEDSLMQLWPMVECLVVSCRHHPLSPGCRPIPRSVARHDILGRTFFFYYLFFVFILSRFLCSVWCVLSTLTTAAATAPVLNSPSTYHFRLSCILLFCTWHRRPKLDELGINSFDIVFMLK